MSARSRNPLADWPLRRIEARACLSPRQYVRMELVKLNWNNPHPSNGTHEMTGVIEQIGNFVLTGHVKARPHA